MSAVAPYVPVPAPRSLSAEALYAGPVPPMPELGPEAVQRLCADGVRIQQRSLGSIAAFHGLEVDELVSHLGRRVIDSGSGGSSLATELAPDRTVVSVDIFRDQAATQPHGIQGRWDALPVAPGSAETYISTFGTPYWCTNPGEVRNSMADAERILMPGGKLLITPWEFPEHDLPWTREDHDPTGSQMLIKQIYQSVKQARAHVAESGQWNVLRAGRHLIAQRRG